MKNECNHQASIKLCDNNIPYKMTSTMADTFNCESDIVVIMYKTQTIAKANNKKQTKKKKKKRKKKKETEKERKSVF